MSLLGASLRALGVDVRAQDVAVVDGAGNHVTGFDSSRPANATLTSVATSTTSAELAAANAARRQLFIHNDSSKTLYVAFAATATTTAFTVAIGANGSVPFALNGYTGVVSGILSSGSGNARVTEVTT